MQSYKNKCCECKVTQCICTFIYSNSAYYNCLHGATVLTSTARDRMGWKCHRQSFSLSSHPLLIAECDRPPTFRQKQSAGLTLLTKIKLSQLPGKRLNNDCGNYGDLLETMVSVVNFLREI